MDILISAERIQQRVAELARQVAADFRDHRPVTIVGVLTGSLMFLADLVRRLDLPLRIGLIQASSYRGEATTPGELRVQPELQPDVRGRHVLLLDDILDSGHTLAAIVDAVRQDVRPLSVKSCVLLRKVKERARPIEADYVGFDIEDEFVVGYGLDYQERYRNLPFIGVLRQP